MLAVDVFVEDCCDVGGWTAVTLLEDDDLDVVNHVLLWDGCLLPSRIVVENGDDDDGDGNVNGASAA